MITNEEKIADVFNKLLQKCGDEYKYSNQRLTGFLAVRGQKYMRELMVVSRAVNGYCCEPTATELTDQSVREKFVSCVADLSKGDPMRWVFDQ